MIATSDAVYALTIDEVGPLHPFELWKTTNGTTWTQIGTDGFGDAGEIGSTGLAEFGGKLYFGTANLTGSSIYRLDSDTNWTKVASGGLGDALNVQMNALREYNGYLYVGTWNPNGAEVWRSTDGDNWTQVADADGGFGNANNTRINSFFYHNNYLYAGTMNNNGAEVWRSTNGTSWSQANTPGFGDVTNLWAGIEVAVVNNVIYMGTRKVPPDAAELFISTNGTTWTQEGSDGFGDTNNFGLYSVTFNGRVYVGFSNPTTGAEIWRSETMDVLAITTESLPEGTVGSEYTAELESEQGTTPLSWSVSAGSLPDGLSMDTGNGTISGTPTKSGEFDITVTVLDSGAPQQLASREYTIKINDKAEEVLPETGFNNNYIFSFIDITNYLN